MRLTRMRTLGLAMLPAVAMVALGPPVLANQTSRDVHVPEDDWFDVATRRVVKGPADLIRYPADLAQTPTFIRLGTRDTGILMRSFAPGASQRPAP